MYTGYLQRERSKERTKNIELSKTLVKEILTFTNMNNIFYYCYIATQEIISENLWVLIAKFAFLNLLFTPSANLLSIILACLNNKSRVLILYFREPKYSGNTSKHFSTDNIILKTTSVLIIY